MVAEIDLIARKCASLSYLLASEQEREGRFAICAYERERGGITLFKLGNLSRRLRLRFR